MKNEWKLTAIVYAVGMMVMAVSMVHEHREPRTDTSEFGWWSPAMMLLMIVAPMIVSYMAGLKDGSEK